MVDRLGVNNGTHELKLGKSFTKDDPCFHTFRYDFKPASVDKSKMSVVEMGERNSATVTVPHVDGEGKTAYKGNKRPVQKECVLIIDHQTGAITLEKISSALQLKKTRTEGPRAQLSRPSTPVEQTKTQKPAVKPEHAASSQNASQSASQNSNPAPKKDEEPAEMTAPLMSASSSDSDSSSSDDEEKPSGGSPQKSASSQWAQPRKRTASLLREDLDLSESGSDSE